jgi:hypothetical protein
LFSLLRHGVQNQGDQIGRMFAYGAIIFFWKFFENYRMSINTWISFFHGESNVCIDFDKKCVGLHFWPFFHKLICSPCSKLSRLLSPLNHKQGSAQSLANTLYRPGLPGGLFSNRKSQFG